jgi:[ribosomal protein S18]-alanine N-acetyltransferase
LSDIRLLAEPELGLLARLHAACFEDAWDETTLAELLAMPGAFALICEAGEGFALARAVAGEAEILSLGVAPTKRRRGLAQRLVSATAAEARRRGAGKLFLEVASDNFPALALYRQAGFVGVGRREGYYRRSAGAIAAEVLALDLVEGAGPELRGGPNPSIGDEMQ